MNTVGYTLLLLSCVGFVKSDCPPGDIFWCPICNANKRWLTCRLTHVKTKKLAHLVLGAVLDDEKRAVALKDIATNSGYAINELTSGLSHNTNRALDIAMAFLNDLEPTFEYPVNLNRIVNRILTTMFEMNEILVVVLFLLKVFLLLMILRLIQETLFEAIDVIKYRRVRDRRFIPIGLTKRSTKALEVCHV